MNRHLFKMRRKVQGYTGLGSRGHGPLLQGDQAFMGLGVEAVHARDNLEDSARQRVGDLGVARAAILQ